MNETELERLVVRLTADIQGYLAAMDEAKEKNQETSEEVEKHWSETWAALGQDMLQYVAEWDKFKEESLAAWSEAEVVAVKLETTLKSNGRAVNELMEDYGKFASEIQDLTGQSDEATQMLLRTAETFELTGEAAKAAARDAIGLASVTGGSAEGMLRMAAAMQKGDTETAMRFARMVPQLRGVRNETEFLVKYTKLVEDGFRAAAAEGQTHAGRTKILKEAYGDLQEQFGKLIADAEKMFISLQLGTVKALQGLPEWSKNLVRLGLNMAALGVAGMVALPAIVKFLPVISAGWKAYATSAAVATSATLLLKSAVVGLTAYGGMKLIGWLTGATQASKDYAAAMDVARKVSVDAAAAQGTLNDAAMKRVAGASDKKTQAAEETKKLEAQLKNQEETVAKLRAMQAEGTEGFTSFDEFVYGMFSGGDATDAQLADAENSAASIKRTLGHIQKLATEHADKKAIEAMFDAFAAGAQIAESVRTPSEKLNMELEKLDDALDAGTISWEVYVLAMTKAQKEFTATQTGMDALIALFEEGAKVTASFATPQQRLNDEIDRLDELLEAGAITADVYAKAVKAAGKEMDDLTLKDMSGLFDDFAEAARIVEENRTPLEKYNDQMDKLTRFHEEGALTDKQFQTAQEKAAQQLENELKNLDKHAKKTQAIFKDIKLDAQAAGSGEGEARVATFRESISVSAFQQLDVDKQQLAEQKAQTKVLVDIRNKKGLEVQFAGVKA